MTRKDETLRGKAKDGKEFTTYVSFWEGFGWDVNDNEVYLGTKKEAMLKAKNILNGRIEDYEFDNDLM